MQKAMLYTLTYSDLMEDASGGTRFLTDGFTDEQLMAAETLEIW